MKNKDKLINGGDSVSPLKEDANTNNADSDITADSPLVANSSFPAGLFPIVGIGASAGGLAAFEEFFSGMPADIDPGMAFVLVQHLAPDHKSILTDLIRNYTRMQVFEVEDGMEVKPNCTYIIPPNRDMEFVNGRLKLLEFTTPHGLRLPIDYFFRSLARELRENGIGIVLSGTGSDGTSGIRAIKGEGGLTIAQDPDSTQYDGMPINAISTGLIDYILAPSAMPEKLIAFTNHSYGKNIPIAKPKTEIVLKKIYLLLRTQTGHDFSQYKPSTIHRRIERRMALHHIESVDNYLKFLQHTPEEVESLFSDLLIGVTSFFRDPETFKALEEIVIPKLFEGKLPGSLIRIWSAGCSTGEEAYSLAIILAEFLEKLKKNFRIQIFATDIDIRSFSSARVGIFPASISTDISSERLIKYFTVESDGSAYRINKLIRDMLVFSEQDINKDPPFSKLDFLCCRNLLIYMGSELQKKLIPLFHYALNPGGLLFLGSSETVGEFSDLFAPLDRKIKLYRRKENFQHTSRITPPRFIAAPSLPDDAETIAPAKMFLQTKLPVREITEQALLKQITSAGVLVNSHGDIYYQHGRTGKFLEPMPGEAGINNILKMAREGLQHELSMALHKAFIQKEKTYYPNLLVKTNGDFTPVNLTICPVNSDKLSLNRKESLFLIILEESSGVSTEKFSADGNYPPDAVAIIESLKKDLRAKEEYLQTSKEELETSNEELKSSNEEMQSVNEELHSTNEELETSKEELQSVNEELVTVNTELQTKISELFQANNDMNNLLAGTGVGTVFVNNQLRILRFTPAATRFINLIPGDIGRPVNHIVSNLAGYDRLIPDAQSVLDTLVPKEVDVQTTEGKWYKMHILPYRTLENVIEGVVITFFDITDMKQKEEKIKKLLEEKELVLKEVHHRIKNHLSVINSLLSLQTDMTEEPIAIAALKDAMGRVQSMMMLYEKLYLTANFSRISVANYLPFLVDDIIANFPNRNSVKVQKKIDDVVLDIKRVQLLGIVINELLTNIMKHAFIGRESGMISLSIIQNGEIVSLSIHDNGNGMPESIDFENSTGFGLMLVGMLTKQIDGTIRIERLEGTTVILQFEI